MLEPVRGGLVGGGALIAGVGALTDVCLDVVVFVAFIMLQTTDFFVGAIIVDCISSTDASALNSAVLAATKLVTI